MLMTNDEFVKNNLITNDGLMVGDPVYGKSKHDLERERIERGFRIASTNTNQHWFVLLCRTGSELLIRDELDNRGVEVYAPDIVPKKKRIRGRWVRPNNRAVFGGYVFLNVPYDGDVFAAISSLDNAYQLVSLNDKPVIVPEYKILIMRMKHSSGVYGEIDTNTEFSWIKEGAKCIIRDGYFEGVEAIITRVTDTRAYVWADAICGKIKLDFSLDMIEERN